jgi:glyoxylase-like metal-dependent hydrolase (beta-lactamase superfamily II)
MKVSPSCYAICGFGFTPPWSVNAGFIAGQSISLIVDAGPSAMAAQSILGYARAVRPGNQILLVNTEGHLDHILGNCVFAEEGIEILGHGSIHRTASDFKECLHEFNAAILDPVRQRAAEQETFFSGTRVVNPHVAIHVETTLELGSIRAEILLAPGHTKSNLLIWIPAEGVLFAGDTVVSGYIPNLASGATDQWILWKNALNRILNLRPTILVPGHGPVQKGLAIQETISRILAFLETAIQTGSAPTS